MQGKFLIIVGAVLALTMIGSVILSDSEHEGVVLSKRHATSESSIGVINAPNSIEPLQNTVKLDVDPTSFDVKTPEISHLLEESRDYRVLFESLLNSSFPGASLYASHIIKQCVRIRSSNFSSGSTSTKQDAARDLMLQRCSTFSSDELSDARRLRLAKDARLRNDYEEFKNTLNSAASDKRQAAFERIVAANDPLLIEQVGPAMLYKLNPPRIVFDGKSYEPTYAQLIFNILGAAACTSTGTSCSSNDQYVVEFCAQTAICTSSRVEMVKAQSKEYFGEKGQELFEELYPKMVSSLKSNSTGSFFKN